MKIALTDLAVQKLKPGTYFDTRTPAFGIRVGKHSRTWIATKGQQPRKTVTLGHYPAMSLQDARRHAFAAFVAPDDRNSKIAFPEARTLFLSQPGRWRPQTLRVLTSNLKHFDWKQQLKKVTHEHVIEKLEAIDGKSARAHALKDVRTFFNWCIPRYLTSSPANGIRMERLPSRERVLSDEELRSVWGASEELDTFGAIVRLLIVTGQRRNEIGSLQWSWIQGGRFTWPASATKNNREHSIPMGRCAASIVAGRRANGQFVFPARARGGQPPAGSFVGWSSSLAKLQKLSMTSEWTLHDIRRTFATGLARIGTPIHVTEKLLNHVSGSLAGVAGIYNRFDYWEDQVKALNQWEEYVTLNDRGSVQGGHTEPPLTFGKSWTK